MDSNNTGNDAFTRRSPTPTKERGSASFVADSDQKFRMKESTAPRTSTLLILSIRLLHFAYAIGIFMTIHWICKNLRSSYILLLISLLIGVPLILDNMRLSVPGLSPQVHTILSKICFFAHEVITPFGLLYVPRCLVSNDNHWSCTGALIISIGLAFLGLKRFFSYKGWCIVCVNGIDVCRPSNSSHGALIPIFVTVGGLIFVSAWSFFYLGESRLKLLLLCQTMVFVGNGCIGPNKVLSGLFGNGFEVLWLWSIVTSLASPAL